MTCNTILNVTVVKHTLLSKWNHFSTFYMPNFRTANKKYLFGCIRRLNCRYLYYQAKLQWCPDIVTTMSFGQKVLNNSITGQPHAVHVVLPGRTYRVSSNKLTICCNYLTSEVIFFRRFSSNRAIRGGDRGWHVLLKETRK